MEDRGLNLAGYQLSKTTPMTYEIMSTAAALILPTEILLKNMQLSLRFENT